MVINYSNTTSRSSRGTTFATANTAACPILNSSIYHKPQRKANRILVHWLMFILQYLLGTVIWLQWNWQRALNKLHNATCREVCVSWKERDKVWIGYCSISKTMHKKLKHLCTCMYMYAGYMSVSMLTVTAWTSQSSIVYGEYDYSVSNKWKNP